MPSRSPPACLAATRLAALAPTGPLPSPRAWIEIDGTGFDRTGERGHRGDGTVSGSANILPVGLVRGG